MRNAKPFRARNRMATTLSGFIETSGAKRRSVCGKFPSSELLQGSGVLPAIRRVYPPLATEKTEKRRAVIGARRRENLRQNGPRLSSRHRDCPIRDNLHRGTHHTDRPSRNSTRF